MAEYTYNFTIDQFPNDKYDLSKLDREIRESSITVSLDHLNGSETDIDAIFRNPLIHKDLTTLSGVVQTHDGEDDYVEYEAVKIVEADEGVRLNTHMYDVPYDKSGKLRVHQTSRKLGTRVMWTGIGDDTSDITKVGGGETLSFEYQPGNTDPMVKYIDFNCIENETWLHEGYLTWENGKLDTLSLQMVPRIVSVEPAAGTSMTMYGGYLVVPTPPGEGNYVVTSDLTQPHGGLVYMPNNDLGETPTAYWDADYNVSTHEFENIRPNYTAQGRYNIFSYEVIFAEFMRQIPFLGSGFIPLNSSDTDQLGNGMRLKMIADTNTSVADHAWSIACIMCLHRDHSI